MNQDNFIPLKYIEDERGAVLHFIKKTDYFFNSFGECYFSWVVPGITKGWYRHSKHTSYLTSPTVNLQVVLFTDPINNKFSVLTITKENYGLIKIPAGIWYAIRSLDTQTALIVNILNDVYLSQEVEKLPFDTESISFDWSNYA